MGPQRSFLTCWSQSCGCFGQALPLPFQSETLRRGVLCFLGFQEKSLYLEAQQRSLIHKPRKKWDLFKEQMFLPICVDSSFCSSDQEGRWGRSYQEASLPPSIMHFWGDFLAKSLTQYLLRACSMPGVVSWAVEMKVWDSEQARHGLRDLSSSFCSLMNDL
jgi:hypothetical protein